MSAPKVYSIFIRSEDRLTGGVTNNYNVNINTTHILDSTAEAPKYYRLTLESLVSKYATNSNYKITSDNTGYVQVLMGFNYPYKATTADGKIPGQLAYYIPVSSGVITNIFNPFPPLIINSGSGPGSLQNSINIQILNESNTNAGGVAEHVIVLSLEPIYE